jgi:hypothetical protein
MDMTLTNIVYWFLAATEAEIAEGTEWYRGAHALALELSPDDVWRGAGILAAFSPLTPWTQNVILARRLFENDGIMEGGTLANSINAATRIYNGEHPLDVLKGDKTRAFCAAIADPEGSTIATIDRHAFNIAMGTVEGNPKVNRGMFRNLSDAYVEAAELCGVSVAQIQAITWVAFRRWKGVKV